MLAWIDVETSGLNPQEDLLFEVGLIVTDDQLEERFRDHWILQYDAAMLEAIQEICSPTVLEMHLKSGLWRDLAIPSGVNRIQPQQLDSAMMYAAYRAGSGWSQSQKVARIAGFNPGFDLNWLRVWAPKFASTCLHYGVFDSSTLREFVRYVYPTGWGPSQTKPQHRSLGDCQAALDYARWFRANVMSPYNRAAGA